MYLQGNLDLLFCTLDSMNCIDDVLKMDWKLFLKQSKPRKKECDKAVNLINNCNSNPDKLKATLSNLPSFVLQYLAIEVGFEMLQCETYKKNNIVAH